MKGLKKELGLDKYGVQKTMRAADYIGDGIGQLSLAIINGLIGQLTYFYTEKVGAAAAMVATAILIPKILDAFSDVIMGKIMDNSNSPKGKCRPWFLRMVIPVAINMFLLFTIPDKASTGAQMIYIIVTNTLMSAVVYTAIAIPYSSLQAMRTRSAEERGTMGIVRTIFNMVGGAIAASAIIPVTNALGGDQKAWIIVGGIFAVVAALSLLVTYFTAKETGTVEKVEEDVKKDEKDTVENISLRQGISILLHNKFWVIMALISVVSGINYGLMGGNNTYYAKYIFGDDNLAAILAVVSAVPMAISFLLVPVMNKKWGMRNSILVSFIIGVIGNVFRAALPYNFIVCIIGSAMSMFAMVPLMCFQGAMLNNTVEYSEWKFGHRVVGLTNSVNSFAGKLSGSVGGSVIGWTLAASGYVTGAAAEMQPESVRLGVMAFSIYLPMALYIIMSLLMKAYTLQKDYGKIVDELNERNNNRGKEA